VLDERRGRIEPVSGDYSDSALQYLSRSVIKRDSDTKAVRYEGQLPQVDGMDADFYLTSTPILGVPCFLRRNSVDNL
jgi:hypothetical protein